MNDWRLSPHARKLILLAVAAPAAAFILGFVVEAFHNPLALTLSPFVAIFFYEAPRSQWTTWDVALYAALIFLGLVFFLISPSYVGRLL